MKPTRAMPRFLQSGNRGGSRSTPLCPLHASQPPPRLATGRSPCRPSAYRKTGTSPYDSGQVCTTNLIEFLDFAGRTPFSAVDAIRLLILEVLTALPFMPAPPTERRGCLMPG